MSHLRSIFQHLNTIDFSCYNGVDQHPDQIEIYKAYKGNKCASYTLNGVHYYVETTSDNCETLTDPKYQNYFLNAFCCETDLCNSPKNSPKVVTTKCYYGFKFFVIF